MDCPTYGHVYNCLMLLPCIFLPFMPAEVTPVEDLLYRFVPSFLVAIAAGFGIKATKKEHPTEKSLQVHWNVCIGMLVALFCLIIGKVARRQFYNRFTASVCGCFLIVAISGVFTLRTLMSIQSRQAQELELQTMRRKQAEIEERHWEESMVSIVRKELVDLGVIDDDSVFDALKQFNYIRTDDELTKAIRYFNSLIYGDQVPTEEKPNPPVPESAEPKQTNIPHFWPTIFGNLTLIAANINEADKPVLEDLINLRITIFKEPRGFELKFVFRENQYFTNEVLRKKINYSEKVDSNGEKCLSVDRVVGCNIVWKTGKNLTLNEGQKSFFNFFESPNANTDLNTSDFEFSKHVLLAMAVFNMPSIGIADDDE